ncbi:hypothetical protein ATJ97_1562 [Georgenia soli]|uniref:Uncharacterized protein n=1 Tax=Georgenia soli TaxID=638953 RepID=A0A2A9EJ12_9MICO|nr:hypothetical protein [Georgenia soli]PFG39067.1 hypothetical protein ATJ97_1562 [Georgenia soli]
MHEDDYPSRKRLWEPTEKALKDDTADLRAAVLQARGQAVWGKAVTAVDDVTTVPDLGRYLPPRPRLDEVLLTEPPAIVVRAVNRFVLVLAEAALMRQVQEASTRFEADDRVRVSGYADGNADEAIEILLTDLTPGLHEVIARRRRYRLGEIPDDVSGENFVEQDPYPWTTPRRDACWESTAASWQAQFAALAADMTVADDVARAIAAPRLGSSRTSVRMTPRAILGD